MTVARRGRVVLLCAVLVTAAGTPAPGRQPAATSNPGPAFFLRSLQSPAERREARPDILDAPVLPGSIVKVVTLAAALESQVIEPDHSRMCRRVDDR